MKSHLRTELGKRKKKTRIIFRFTAHDLLSSFLSPLRYWPEPWLTWFLRSLDDFEAFIPALLGKSTLLELALEFWDSSCFPDWFRRISRKILVSECFRKRFLEILSSSPGKMSMLVELFLGELDGVVCLEDGWDLERILFQKHNR